MRNITVSVDEETYRQARVRAAEQDTSVSAIVRELLASYVEQSRSQATSPDESALDRRRRPLAAVFEEMDARGTGIRMADNLSRDDLHDRALARAEIQDARSRPSNG